MGNTIEIILFSDALGLDITGPLEVFNTANELVLAMGDHIPPYKIRFIATRKGPVRLSSGLEILARHTFNESSKADILIVPGGSGIRDIVDDSEFIEAVRKLAKRAKRIISVCNGAFILAAAGLLDGKKATTHWMVADELASNYPQINVIPDAIYICDGNVYTSAGVTTGIDLALAIVEEDLGVALALEVSRLLVLYFKRPGSQSQFSAPLQAQKAAGSQFADLHAWLVSNLERTITVETMAEIASMSPRNFARVFKKTTGLTPNKYLETLRLDRAREILSNGSASIEDIAVASGFGREERLRRAFLRQFQVTPSQFRLHFSKSELK